MRRDKFNRATEIEKRLKELTEARDHVDLVISNGYKDTTEDAHVIIGTPLLTGKGKRMIRQAFPMDTVDFFDLYRAKLQTLIVSLNREFEAL